jgi:ligand-binding sensor domain-containing protein/signal transduction histidine kinase
VFLRGDCAYSFPMITDRARWLGRNCLLALLACLPVIARASTPQPLPQDLAMRVWTKQQGLPDDSVTSVLQTRDGYLWVGTSGGLARFDGVRFVLIAPRSQPPNTPICVTALCEDSAGRLWIGTQASGLLCYVGGLVTRLPGTGSLPDGTINSIADDAAGNLWLGTPSGLSRLAGAQLTRFTARDGLPNDFVSSVHVARSGTVWISTRGGMCQFKDGRIYPFPFQTDSPGRSPESLGVYEDRRGNLWAFGDTYLVNLTEGKHLNHFGSRDTTASKRIWSLCEGRRGELWIGTSGQGLYCFADDKFTPLAPHNGGLTSDVRALCEDREGNLWLGTYGGGLVRLQPRNVRVLNAGAGLPDRPPVSLGFNSQGRGWIGFERGGLYAGAAESFERVSGESGSDFQNLVSTICVTADSNLWVGTPGNGLYCLANQKTLHYTTANGLSDDSILSLAADSEGGVWAGTFSGGLHRFAGGELTSYGASSGLPREPVTAILAAHTGGVWIGFAGGQVFRGQNGAFRSVVEPALLAGKAIHALHEDAAGHLWLGAASGRLGCLTGSRFLSWDLNLGSADRSILGILGDDLGDLWLGTGGSIYRAEQRNISASLANQDSIRPQLIFTAEATPNLPPAYGWPRALKSPDGKLWFGLVGGMVVLDARGAISDAAPPSVVIEEIAVNSQPISRTPAKPPAAPASGPEAPVRLSPDLSSLEIHFTALHFSAPEKIQFRHRLEGFDPDWVVDGDKGRSVHYGRLPYGVYTFHVQAGTADGAWHENGAAFTFLRPKPVWRTDLALAVYGLAGVILVTLTARMVSNRRLRGKLDTLAAQQAMERERMRIAQDMHDEIGSKLTKISFMSERAKGELQGQDSVARKLDSIAHSSRDLLQSLDEIVWVVNPHNDTLEHLADYLGQYATEYLQNTAVECELHVPRGLPHHPLSAETRHNLFLAFEESLNNALKHGRASRISVNMVAAPSRFDIKIKDNGRGFDPTPSMFAPQADGTPPGKRGGNGMRNMSQRLAEAGGRCEIRSQAGHGTTVTFSIPLGTQPIKPKARKI